MKPKAKPVQTIVTPESGHVQVSLKCPIVPIADIQEFTS
jgi:hypothetical protein